MCLTVSTFNDELPQRESEYRCSTWDSVRFNDLTENDPVEEPLSQAPGYEESVPLNPCAARGQPVISLFHMETPAPRIWSL